MSDLFLRIFNVGITAGWLCLAVVVMRLLLKKAPKALICLLWAVVGLRLVFPFSIESVLSLIPSAQTLPPEIIYTQTPIIDSGIPPINDVINPTLSQSMAPVPGDSINPMQAVVAIAAIVWVVGVVVMLGYMAISYLRIRLRVREATPVERGVWICDRVDSPFILGVLRPRIYLPSDLKESDRAFVMAHERAHLRRRDHFWKPLGFLLLSVYWFHPLLWVAYILLCRDIEFACDEKVLGELGDAAKHDYSMALVNCSVPKKQLSACPVAFGETGVVDRVKRVMYYKKPGFWIILATVVALTVTAVCFLTNPPEKDAPPSIDTKNAVALLYRDAEDYYYSSPEKLQAIADCINGMTLNPVPKDEEPQIDATKVYIFVTYGDGTQRTLVLQGNCVQSLGEKWYRMESEELKSLQALLWETPTDPAPVTGTVFDYLGTALPEGSVEWTVAQFPDVIFRCDYQKLEAVTKEGTATLFEGSSIQNLILVDLNYDGNPEFCGTVYVGRGTVKSRIEVYDYANGKDYEMAKDLYYNYYIKLVNGRPMALKKDWVSQILLSVGTLELSPVGNAAPLYMSDEIEMGDDVTNISCNLGWGSEKETVTITTSSTQDGFKMMLTVRQNGILMATKTYFLDYRAKLFFIPSSDPSGYGICVMESNTMQIRYLSMGLAENELVLWENGKILDVNLSEEATKEIRPTRFGRLSDDVAQEICQALEKDSYAYALGEIGSGYALLVQRSAAPTPRASVVQTVGSMVFRYDDLFTEVQIYRDGRLVSLTEAMELEWITEQDAWTLRLRHAYVDPLGYAEYDQRIRKSRWNLMSDERKKTYEVGDISFKLVCESERYTAIFISEPGMIFIDMMTSERVGGVSFNYPSTQKMSVCINGKLYSLQEAYEAGLLTTQDLRDIRYAYTNFYRHVWEMSWEIFNR